MAADFTGLFSVDEVNKLLDAWKLLSLKPSSTVAQIEARRREMHNQRNTIGSGYSEQQVDAAADKAIGYCTIEEHHYSSGDAVIDPELNLQDINSGPALQGVKRVHATFWTALDEEGKGHARYIPPAPVVAPVAPVAPAAPAAAPAATPAAPPIINIHNHPQSGPAQPHPAGGPTTAPPITPPGQGGGATPSSSSNWQPPKRRVLGWSLAALGVVSALGVGALIFGRHTTHETDANSGSTPAAAAQVASGDQPADSSANSTDAASTPAAADAGSANADSAGDSSAGASSADAGASTASANAAPVLDTQVAAVRAAENDYVRSHPAVVETPQVGKTYTIDGDAPLLSLPDSKSSIRALIKDGGRVTVQPIVSGMSRGDTNEIMVSAGGYTGFMNKAHLMKPGGVG